MLLSFWIRKLENIQTILILYQGLFLTSIFTTLSSTIETGGLVNLSSAFSLQYLNTKVLGFKYMYKLKPSPTIRSANK